MSKREVIATKWLRCMENFSEIERKVIIIHVHEWQLKRLREQTPLAKEDSLERTAVWNEEIECTVYTVHWIEKWREKMESHLLSQ